MIWRVVIDPRIPDGLADIRSGWTFTDLVHAHNLLDQLDAQAARERAKVGRLHG